MSEMKCWFVRQKGDDLGEFVFAQTRGKAIYDSLVYWDPMIWVEIRAVRVPELDEKKISRENVEAAGFIWLEE